MKDLARIRKDYPQFCRVECKDIGHDAQLQITGFREKVILKVDEIFNEIKMVDFFVYAKNNDIIVVILELKGRRFDDDDVKSKFNNGSPECEKLFNKYFNKMRLSGFYPIFLVPSVKSRFQWENLKGHIIQFRGHDYKLIRETGVIELTKIMEKWS